MLKKCIGLSILILCLALSNFAFCEELKIGYINMRKVFYEYKKTKEFNEKLEKEDKGVKEEIEKRTQEIRKLKDEMDLLSEKAQEKKEPEMRQQIKELDAFRREKVDGILQNKEKMFKEIRSDILDISEGYAKQQGYDIILDGALFVYSSKKYDVTDEIIKKLNK